VLGRPIQKTLRSFTTRHQVGGLQVTLCSIICYYAACTHYAPCPSSCWPCSIWAALENKQKTDRCHVCQFSAERSTTKNNVMKTGKKKMAYFL